MNDGDRFLELLDQRIEQYANMVDNAQHTIEQMTEKMENDRMALRITQDMRKAYTEIREGQR